MFLMTHARKILMALNLILILLIAVTASAAASAPAVTAGQADGTTGRGFSTTFSYYYVAGSTLTTRDSTSGWGYSGVGCVSLANGDELFTVSLELPEGARIDYLRLFYRDTSASNGMAWLTTYDGAGNFTDLTSVSSAGNGGYGTTLSPYLGHVVNNASRAYVLNWAANQTGNTMQLCGLRVAYRLAVNEFYLPLLMRRS